MKKVSKIELIRTLEQELNYKRFVHTLSVAGTAASLGLLTVFFAFQLSKPEPEKKPDESVQPEKTESRGEETK